jgi:hypothetical protein
MSTPPHDQQSQPRTLADPAGDEEPTQPELNGTTSGQVPSGPPEPVETLSAEEQMARYEEALKEEDWGHQPC